MTDYTTSGEKTEVMLGQDATLVPVPDTHQVCDDKEESAQDCHQPTENSQFDLYVIPSIVIDECSPPSNRREDVINAKAGSGRHRSRRHSRRRSSRSTYHSESSHKSRACAEENYKLSERSGARRTSDTNVKISTNVNTIGESVSTIFANPEIVSADVTEGTSNADAESGHFQNLTCASVNKNAWAKSSVPLINELGQTLLKEPNLEVEPQMKMIKNFYERNHVEVEDIKFLFGLKKLFKRFRKKSFQNQLIMERGFSASSDSQLGEKITLNGLLDSFFFNQKLKEKEKLPVTAIVASAGAGKTTVLHRMVRKTMQRSELVKKHSFLPSHHRRFHMVHYRELFAIPNKKSMSPSKFLFGDVFEDESQTNEAFEYLLRNQSKAMIHFDGFDQVTWDMTKTKFRKIDHHETTDPPTIFFNILSRNILPQVKIIITSRKYKVSSLSIRAQPAEIVALEGFSFEDTKRLFLALLRNKGNECWNEMSKFSKRLINLMSVPSLLQLTAFIMAEYHENTPLNTVTELYNIILNTIAAAENIQGEEPVLGILSKLESVAHEGVKKGRVVFTEAQLTKCNFTIKDVRNVMRKVPGSDVLTGRLSEQDIPWSFFHQSFQEYFSGRFVTKMNLKDFEKFCRKRFFSCRWSITLAFTCGLVFQSFSNNPSSSEMPSNVSRDLQHDNKEKRIILKKYLLKKLENCNGYQLINTLSAVYETGDNRLIKNVQEIDLSNTPINSNSAHLLSIFLAKCSVLQSVNLENCMINDEIAEIIHENLGKSRLEIRALNLQCNELTKSGLNSLLSKFTIEELSLHSKDCADTGTDPLALDSIQCLKIQSDDFIVRFQVKDNQLSLKTDDTDAHFSEYPLVIKNSYSTLEQLLEFARPKAMILRNLEKQFLSWEDLQSMSFSTETPKINELVVRCTDDKEVEPSKIVSYVRRLGVKELDLIVDDETTYNQNNALTGMEEKLTLFGCKFNVHYKYSVYGKNQLNGLIPMIKREVIKKLRIRLCYGACFDDILPLTDERNLEMIVIVHDHRSNFSSREKMRFTVSADRFGTQVQFRSWDEIPKDAWYWSDLW